MRQIRIKEFSHKGGTKDYHTVEFLDDRKNKGRFFKRWGKLGTSGQLQEPKFNLTNIGTVNIANKEERIRTSSAKGYRLDIIKIVDENDSDWLWRLESGLSNSSFIRDTHLLHSINEWLAHPDTVFARTPEEMTTFEPDENIDRGEVWGSW